MEKRLQVNILSYDKDQGWLEIETRVISENVIKNISEQFLDYSGTYFGSLMNLKTHFKDRLAHFGSI